MLRTRNQPCAIRYRGGHPAQKPCGMHRCVRPHEHGQHRAQQIQDVTKPRFSVGVCNRWFKGVLTHRAFRLAFSMPRHAPRFQHCAALVQWLGSEHGFCVQPLQGWVHPLHGCTDGFPQGTGISGGGASPENSGHWWGGVSPGHGQQEPTATWAENLAHDLVGGSRAGHGMGRRAASSGAGPPAHQRAGRSIWWHTGTRHAHQAGHRPTDGHTQHSHGRAGGAK